MTEGAYMKPQIYTAREIAEKLKCNTQTVYRLGKTGAIKRLKVGKLVRFYMPGEESVNEQEKTFYSIRDGSCRT